MKTISKAFAFFATFAVIFLLSSVNISAQKTAKPDDGRSQKPTVGLPTPKVTKIDELSIKELLKPKKKPLLVNFWATWCIPCREEFPDLVELDKEYKGKIDFITISLDDLAEINRDVPKFLAEMKASMPAYLLRTNDENAVIGSISKDWAGGLPFTVLYNDIGTVMHTRQGKIRPEIVKSKLNNLVDSESKNLTTSSLKIRANDGKYEVSGVVSDAELRDAILLELKKTWGKTNVLSNNLKVDVNATKFHKGWWDSFAKMIPSLKQLRDGQVSWGKTTKNETDKDLPRKVKSLGEGWKEPY